MALTGDTDELLRIARNLESIDASLRIARERAAHEITASARAGYAQGRAPDGRKWEPTKDGRLAVQGPASQVEFIATDTGIEGRAPEVLQYHEETRPVFPDGIIPPEWDAILTRAHEEALDEHTKGK